MRKYLLSAVALLGFATAAHAQDVLKTGGKTGDYYRYFGPPLVTVLDRAWADVTIDTSNGTPDSMGYLLQHPHSYALAQGNVYAGLIKDPRYANQFKVLPAKIGDEAVLGIMSDHIYQRSRGSWEMLAHHAGQVRWAMAPQDSGPGFTFVELMQLDPEGLGKARQVSFYNSMDEALSALQTGQADVSLIVQFGNPANPRFKQIAADHLHLVPVLMPQMKDLTLPDGQRAFTLCPNVPVSDSQEITTACSPILAITGATNDNADLNTVFKSVKPEDFAPKEPAFAQLWRKLRSAAVSASSSAFDTASRAANDVADKINEKLN